MFILIKSKENVFYIVRKDDIRIIHSHPNNESVIRFTDESKNTPIVINGTPEDFFNTHFVK